MSSNAYQLRTRSKEAHPGLVGRATQHRSREEVARDKKAKEDAKMEKKLQDELVKASKVKRIAGLEERMDEEDANSDLTPRPPANKKANMLRRTASFLPIPLINDGSNEFLDKMEVDENTHLSTDNSGDEFRPTDTDEGRKTEREKTETEDEGPAKKKAKVTSREKKPKVLMRDAIAAAREAGKGSAAAALFGVSDSEDNESLAVKQKVKAVKADGKGRVKGKGKGKEMVQPERGQERLGRDKGKAAERPFDSDNTTLKDTRIASGTARTVSDCSDLHAIGNSIESEPSKPSKRFVYSHPV